MSGRQLLRLGRTYRHARLTAASAQLHMGQANVPQSTPGIKTSVVDPDPHGCAIFWEAGSVLELKT
jgi:hypothetical protein